MQATGGKLSLFIFIDAFGWAVKERHPRFLSGLIRDSRPLETILGYSSACDPSIISGLTPSEHGLWCSYYFDPENSPFKWTRALRFLPDAFFSRGRVRHHLSRWVGRACGFSGYFHLYAVPFEYLPLFNYAEQRRIWEPGGLPRGRTIFDELAERGIPYHVHDSHLPDDRRLDRLETDLMEHRVEFAYCSLGKLDALMHAEGIDTPQVGHLLEEYDRRIRRLLEIAEKNYDEVAWYVITDHGMHNVTETYDLAADIQDLGLVWQRDYIAFYDATIARIWILNEEARATIVRCLSNHPKGRILSEAELKAFGVYFADGQYGDLIFLMHPGIQIVPSFMGRQPVKGMHGYHPSDPDSLAAISSNKPIPHAIARIQHIYRIMLDEAGV